MRLAGKNKREHRAGRRYATARRSSHTGREDPKHRALNRPWELTDAAARQETKSLGAAVLAPAHIQRTNPGIKLTALMSAAANNAVIDGHPRHTQHYLLSAETPEILRKDGEEGRI